MVVRNYISALFIAAFAVSCMKENFSDAGQDYQEGFTYINIPSGDELGKTVLDSDGTSVKWVHQDKLVVFDEDFTGVIFSTDKDNVASATFKTDAWTGKTPVYASCSNTVNEATCISGGFLVVKLAPNQSIHSPGTYARTASASVGRVTGSAPAYTIAKMWNVPGLLKVDVDLPNIKSIKVEGLNDEILAGFVRVDYGKITTGEQKNFWIPASGKTQYKSVTIVPSEAALADNSCFKAGSYYIAVLPQSFPKGLKITLTDKNDNVTERKVGTGNGGISVLRNQIRTFDGNINNRLPDVITLDLNFYNDSDVNPLGFGSSPAMTDKGETYGFKYTYGSMGEGRTKIFDFKVCKGSDSEASYKYTTVSKLKPQYAGTKVLFFAKDGGWIQTPEISGHYLQSVTFSHGNATAPKQMQIRPDWANAYNLGATSKATSQVSSETAPNTQIISFPSTHHPKRSPQKEPDTTCISVRGPVSACMT